MEKSCILFLEKFKEFFMNGFGITSGEVLIFLGNILLGLATIYLAKISFKASQCAIENSKENLDKQIIENQKEQNKERGFQLEKEIYFKKQKAVERIFLLQKEFNIFITECLSLVQFIGKKNKKKEERESLKYELLENIENIIQTHDHNFLEINSLLRIHFFSSDDILKKLQSRGDVVDYLHGLKKEKNLISFLEKEKKEDIKAILESGKESKIICYSRDFQGIDNFLKDYLLDELKKFKKSILD